MVSLPNDLLSPPARTSPRRLPVLVAVPLPAGAIGGLPFGGGLPCDTVPLFHTNALAAEMPWRAAAGEAHPMAARPCDTPDQLAESDGWPDSDRAAVLPTSAQIPAYPLLIFDQLIRETGWETSVLARGSWVEAAADDTTDTTDNADRNADQGTEWNNAPTRLLPLIEPTRPAVPRLYAISGTVPGTVLGTKAGTTIGIPARVPEARTGPTRVTPGEACGSR